MTPDSSKSTVDKITESVTGAGDKVAREAQPSDTKSTTQKITDSAGHQKDSNKADPNSLLNKAKDAVGLNK